MMERRRFLSNLTGLLMTPVIVPASSLMPIKPWVPAWIRAHRNNPIFGTLIIRRPGVEHLDEFFGLIKPGEFLWKQPNGRLIDMCWFDRRVVTEVHFTASYLSVHHDAYKNSAHDRWTLGVEEARKVAALNTTYPA